MQLFKKKEEVKMKTDTGVRVDPVPPDYEILQRYPIREDLAEVVIAAKPGIILEPIYFVREVELTEAEANTLKRLKDFLSKELEPPTIGEEAEVRKVLLDSADKLIKKYGKGIGVVDENSKRKIFYHLERDMLGFGLLNVIMEDYRIEDISCDGVNVPIYVWHRDYESMPTNIMFTDRAVLDDFIIQLAHKAGKHISSAFPMLDAMIYGKHRLAATFREEISPRGSTFTIRKFREKPFSIVELLRSNVMSTELAAYFWILLENKANIMVAGATGSGKTTLLNALSCFIKPRMKIITCEETAELNMPTENWVRFVTRESYGIGAKIGQITLFDLVRMSLRYRPDYLIVGEIRGEEAFVLFQAIATGHGGLSTVHAESIETAVKRLVSPPMNIPPSHIPLLDVLCLVERTILPRPFKGMTFGRRMRYIWEITDYEKYELIGEWDPLTDTFKTDFDKSLILEQIALRWGKKKIDLIRELLRRKAILEWMVSKGFEGVSEVAKVIYSYYTDPDRFIKEMGIKVEEALVPISIPITKPREISLEKIKTAANYIIELLRANNGVAPYYQVFVKIPQPKDVLVEALKQLKEDGIIYIDAMNIKLKEIVGR
ncbi:MAG: type II/IV secretion system ATPase subunit [Nitrososphaerota archaeon]|nr:type II/IV secretion system ATPase subunit [Nitrososphaerota archaeon]